MTILQKLQQVILPGEVLSVVVGVSRVAVAVRTEAGVRCGLSATLSNPEYLHYIQPAVRQAGSLHKMTAVELASMVESPSLTEAAIGLATINALLPLDPAVMTDLNASDYIVRNCSAKNVALIGHFPFVERIRPDVKNLWVLELTPKKGDLPAEAAPEYIPQADILAITATALINGTFDGLVSLCKPEAEVLILGPSTPLSPILYDYGVNILSGTLVLHPEETLLGIGQAGSTHMLQKQGHIRYVTMTSNDSK